MRADNRFWAAAGWKVLGLAIAFAPGCGAPSLLITPVSNRRELVETELSRDAALVREKIVLIDVSGVIMNSRGMQFFAEGEQPVSLLLEELDRAARDRNVKAVVLRINSPGGTVVASELMHQEIMHFRSATGKPVVAVMMDVAASGGYYIACACDEIIAQPSSVTGSIGVIMQMFDVTGTMKIIGVQSDAISSGKLKDAGSPLRTMKPEERELFQKMVNDMYERFVAVVAAGRPNLVESKVRELADGRLYTATQAKEVGLIDAIAPMRAVVARAKQLAGVESAKLVTYHRPLEYRPNYYATAPRRGGGEFDLLRPDVSAWLETTTPQFMYLWRP